MSTKTARFKTIMFGLLVLVLAVGILFLFYREDEERRAVDSCVKSETYDNYGRFKSADIGAVILCYHRILNAESTLPTAKLLSDNSQLHSFNVAADEFEKQMTYLAESDDVTVIDMDELTWRLAEDKIDKKYVVITFDDIDVSMVQNAVPVLEKYKLPYTTFLITDNTGEYKSGSQMATWEDIDSIPNKKLMTVGMHTNDMHYQEDNLPILMHKDNLSAFKKDFKKNKKKIEEMFDETPKYFAPPFGDMTADKAAYALDNGMEGVYTLDNGLVTSQTKKDDLSRVVVTSKSWQHLENYWDGKSK